jgi:hypothetical protein
MNVFQLARLRLVDLQARYLQMLPTDQHAHSFKANVVELQQMSREQLVCSLLEKRP